MFDNFFGCFLFRFLFFFNKTMFVIKGFEKKITISFDCQSEYALLSHAFVHWIKWSCKFIQLGFEILRNFVLSVACRVSWINLWDVTFECWKDLLTKQSEQKYQCRLCVVEFTCRNCGSCLAQN